MTTPPPEGHPPANAALAADLIARADGRMRERRVLADPEAHMPGAVCSAAIELLGQLAADVPAGESGEHNGRPEDRTAATPS